MENAQLIGLSRQIGLKRQMNVIANNVANINTNGYKAQSLLFEEYVMPVASDNTFGYSDQPLSYTNAWATINDFSGGAIAQTGNFLDIALQGKGFLAVQTPSGERWTRAGSLKIDNSGLLVDNSGNPVLSEGGQIRFAPSETDIRFNEDGSILTSEGNKGFLRIVEFDEPQILTREGDNLFSGGEPIAASDTRVVQGAIERSNVSGVIQIAEMIRVNRSYQSMAKLMERQDKMRSEAIGVLGNPAR